jgi:phosphoribosylformylglycinamidine synthase subunit PurS
MGGRVLSARWTAEVRVALRPGIADPEGQTIASALRLIGYASVAEVRSGKLMRIEFEAEDRGAAEAAVTDMCRRLLANPVMEVATWDLSAADAAPVEVAR